MWVVNTVPARTAVERLVEVEAVLLGELADALEAEEAGVPLVGVEHLGLGVPVSVAVRADRAHAADAEQHLLQQPVLGAAAVEPVGDLALGRRVVLDVGVEQQQRDPADLRPPDLRVQRARRRAARRSTCTGAPSASRSSVSGRPCGSSGG